MSETSKVSFCIIAKNEEKFIDECLKSIEDIAHEVIIIDTGSTDNTKDICLLHSDKFPEKYKIFDYEWQNDFSKARNESIRHATGDWIFVIDADEILTDEGRTHLIPFLTQQTGLEKTVCFNITVIEPNINNLNYVYKSVLFRNYSDIEFIKPFHEHISCKKNELIIYKAKFISLFHLGNQKRTPEEMREKQEKYISRLLELIKNNSPDNYFYYYHLGNSYAGQDKYDQAIKAYISSIELYKKSRKNKKTFFYGNILNSLIKVLVLNKRKYNDALKYIEELLLISPDFPDAHFFKAYCSQHTGNIQKAIKSYEYVISLFSNGTDRKIDPLGINYLENWLFFSVMKELGRCYMVSGDKEKAIYHFEKSFSVNKNYYEWIPFLSLYFLLNENLPGYIDYYKKNHKDISINEKEYLDYVLTIPTYDIRHKVIIGEFLKSLEKMNIDWLQEEIKLVKNKIKEISENTPDVMVCVISEEQRINPQTIKSLLPIASEASVVFCGVEPDKELDINEIPVFISEETDEIKVKNYFLSHVSNDWILFIKNNDIISKDMQKNFLNFLSLPDFKNIPIAFEIMFKYGESYTYKPALFRNGFFINYEKVSNEEKVFSTKHKLKLITTAFTIYSD